MQEFEDANDRRVRLDRTPDRHPDVAAQLPIRDGHGNHLRGQVHRTQQGHHGDADARRDKLDGRGVIGGLDGEIGNETGSRAGIEQDLPAGPAVEVVVHPQVCGQLAEGDLITTGESVTGWDDRDIGVVLQVVDRVPVGGHGTVPRHEDLDIGHRRAGVIAPLAQSQVKAQIAELTKSGASKLIVDVRYDKDGGAKQYSLVATTVQQYHYLYKHEEEMKCTLLI